MASDESQEHEKLPAWHVTEVMSKKEVIEKAQKEGRTVHFANADGTMPTEELGVGAEVLKIQRARRAPR